MWKRLKMPGFRTGIVALMLLAAAGCNLNTPTDGTTETISGAPVVRIIAPLPNATYREGVSVPIQAQVSNAGADIDRAEVSVDGSIIQTFSEPNTSGAPAFSLTHTWTSEGAGTHSIDVIAFRADGTSSASAAVSVTVVTQTAIETEEPSPTSRPTTQPGGDTQTQQSAQQADTAEPTAVPASATPNTPQITTRQGINVRSGPGTNFNPPIGSLAAGATAPLLGRNPAGDWYKIQYYNAEAWVFAGLVDTSGDTSNLPVDAGPPTPAPTQPPPPTAVPATAAPQSSANLVAGNWRFDPPGDPSCNQTFNIFIDVANLGSTATTISGSIDIRDYRVSDGQALGSTIGGFPIIQAGQTVPIGPIPFTVSTYYAEQHRIVITINPNGAVPETTAGDNVKEIVYTLQKGSCP